MTAVGWVTAGMVFVYHPAVTIEEYHRMKAKYVIIKKGSLEVPLVFSELLMHADMAGKHKPTSAGFCQLAANGKWLVAGHSSSLRLNSRPEDAAILNAHL